MSSERPVGRPPSYNCKKNTFSQRFDFTQDLIDRIDDYRYISHIPTRKRSVIELIERGLRAFWEEQRQKAEKELS